MINNSTIMQNVIKISVLSLSLVGFAAATLMIAPANAKALDVTDGNWINFDGNTQTAYNGDTWNGSFAGESVDYGCCDSWETEIVEYEAPSTGDYDFAGESLDYGCCDSGSTYDYYDYGGSGGYAYSVPTYSYPTYEVDHSYDYYEEDHYEYEEVYYEEEHWELVCDLSVTDNHVEEDEYVTVHWDTSGADHVTLSGYGSVSKSGSKYVKVDEDITFTLRVENEHDSLTCKEHVNVEKKDDDLTCDLDVSDTHVEEGEYVTVYWDTSGADDVTLSGYGSVADSGSKEVKVYSDKTFTLRVENEHDSLTCKEHVDVEKKDDDDDEPRCDLEVSDRTIDEGESVRLSWDNEDTDEIRLRTDDGDEIIERDDDDYDEDDDSIRVKPREDTEYILTAYNDEGRDTCRVEVEVDEDDHRDDDDRDEEDDNVTVVVANQQLPRTGTIALDKVPYTGYDASDMLTTSLYVIFGAWVLGVAYYLLRNKKVSVSR